jgi:CheY-like chemotaxis protein
VLGFAKQSGGGVQIETQPGKGTTLRVYFPRSTTAAADQAPLSAESLSAALPASDVSIVADDDDHVRHVTASMLEGLGHVPIEAGSGGAALEALSGKRKIDVALIDFAMPGMSGLELAREARVRLPTLPIVFITGLAESPVLSGIRHEHILRKPFLEHDLDRKIRAALAHKHVGTLDELMSLG